jgi:hypothetical protein
VLIPRDDRPWTALARAVEDRRGVMAGLADPMESISF